ncbi:apolipoprotein N-acyltransferase [bacterium]|nr:apolipoprotein N-acyltransferase [bacterium]
MLHNLLLMLLAPVGWVVLEWVRGRFILGGFPWNFVGVSQHAVPHAIQYAAVTGVYGVSALVAFGNLGIYCTARRFWNQLRTVAPRRRLSWEFYLAVGAMCLPLVYGARTIHRAAPAGESLRLLLVQGNIPQDLKFDPLEKSMILDRYERWTRAGLEFRRPDLIIWPETATPEALRYDPASYALVTNLAATAGVPLLSGTIDYTPRSEPPEGFNAAMLVGPDGAVQQIYRKLHLVPFGEYVPLRKIFPFLKWLTPIPDSFERGEQHTVFTLPASDRNAHPALRFGVVICFEDAVASLYRQFVRQDVDFMVNLTNDAWFKESPAAELHLANAVFRAVESRRPLVRVTNNGVTCIVDQFGIVRNRLDPFREGSLNTELALPATRPTTFYTRYGDVFVGGCALVGALAVAWGWQVRRRTP